MHQPSLTTTRLSRRQLAEAALKRSPGPARQEAIKHYLASHHFSEKSIWTLVCAAIALTPYGWEKFTADDLTGAGLPVTTLIEQLKTSLTSPTNWLKSSQLRTTAQRMKEEAMLTLIQHEHESIMPLSQSRPEEHVAFAFAYANLAEALMRNRGPYPPSLCMEHASALMEGRPYSESIIAATARIARPPARLEEGTTIKRRPVKEPRCAGDPYIDLLAEAS